MENKEIKVSVIMPVYNSGIYLKTAVESILNQSLREMELILVDDGSTDGSSDKCDEYARNDSRVVVIHQKNGGICNARNAALKIAKGEYIGFSDHDDEYLPGLLEKAYRRAIESDADIVKFSKKVLLTNENKIIRERSNSLDDCILNSDDIKRNYLSFFYKQKINCVWDSLFKRGVFLNNNIFFDEFYKCGGEDYDIMARYLPYVRKIAFMSDVMYVHYIRRNISTSFKYNPYACKHIVYLTNVIYDNAQKIGYNLFGNKKESDFFLTEFLINGMSAIITHPQCDFTVSKKKEILSKLRNERCMQFNFGKSTVKSIVKMEKKIGLAYFLYINSFYSFLLGIHRLRNWQNNSKIINFLR